MADTTDRPHDPPPGEDRAETTASPATDQAPTTPVAPAAAPTAAYTATPYGGAPVAYGTPAPYGAPGGGYAATTPVYGSPNAGYAVATPATTVVERPRRRRGLVIGAAIAAGVLLVGLSFGGGVAVGMQVGPRPGFASEQGFPGMGDGTRPQPPEGGFGGPGGNAPGQDDGGTDSDSDTGTDSGS